MIVFFLFQVNLFFFSIIRLNLFRCCCILHLYVWLINGTEDDWSQFSFVLEEKATIAFQIHSQLSSWYAYALKYRSYSLSHSNIHIHEELNSKSTHIETQCAQQDRQSHPLLGIYDDSEHTYNAYSIKTQKKTKAHTHIWNVLSMRHRTRSLITILSLPLSVPLSNCNCQPIATVSLAVCVHNFLYSFPIVSLSVYLPFALIRYTHGMLLLLLMCTTNCRANALTLDTASTQKKFMRLHSVRNSAFFKIEELKHFCYQTKNGDFGFVTILRMRRKIKYLKFKGRHRGFLLPLKSKTKNQAWVRHQIPPNITNRIENSQLCNQAKEILLSRPFNRTIPSAVHLSSLVAPKATVLLGMSTFRT